MSTSIKPMLAATLESLDDLRFPVAATPKLDGVRCIIHPELGPVSRTLKPIPNGYVRQLLSTLPPYLDGELMIPGAKTFGDTTSAIMRTSGAPDFEFCVFDQARPGETYMDRTDLVLDWALFNSPEWVFVLSPTLLENAEQLANYEAEQLARGFEGVMLRDPNGPYKFGRSTLKEGYLLKLKRFEDDEAEVIGYEELHHNSNDQERDERGYAKRSSAKAGQIAGGILGALICRTPEGVEFRIGSGFTVAQRAALWEQRFARGVGWFAKYKHQAHGAKDAPRIPIYLGERHGDDR